MDRNQIAASVAARVNESIAAGRTITYSEIAKPLRLSSRSIYISEALAAMVDEDLASNRPFRSAAVVRKSGKRKGVAGPGFVGYLRAQHNLNIPFDIQFCREQLQALGISK